MSGAVHGLAAPGARVAALLLELEADQAESDRREQIAERAAFRAARAAEVAALHAAADDTALGAWIGAAFSAAGGALSVAGGLEQLEASRLASGTACVPESAAVLELRAQAGLWQATGSAIGQLAAPASGLFGAAATHHQAEARAAAAAAEDHRFSVDSAAEHERRSAQNHGRLLDLLRDSQATTRAAGEAVLDNLG